jgi:lipopolysaccharide transport system permease protein
MATGDLQATHELQATPLRASPPAHASPRIRVVEPRRRGLAAAVEELWRHRRYSLYFGSRFLEKRYGRTWLGVAWLPLRPLIGVATKLLVFGGLIGISAGNIAYPVFFLTATAGWQLFAESAVWSTRSLELNRSFLRVVHVPRLAVIAGAVVPSVVDALIYVGMAAAAIAYYYFRAGIFYLDLTLLSPLYVFGGLALILLLGVGVGLVTASAGARARDIRFSLTYVLGFVYYVTPVIYPFSTIPNSFKPLAELNPMTGAIELFKVGLFRGSEVSVEALLVSVAAVVALWIPGLWLFQRREVREG